MRTDAYIIGTGMTRFGKHLDRGIKSLAKEAVEGAIADAGVSVGQLEAVFSGNAVAGVMTGQEMIRGQVVMQELGIGGVPVVNVENACATGSTALHQAAAMVTAGIHDVVLVVAFEKLYDEDKKRSLAAYGGGVDVERARELVEKARASEQAQSSGSQRDRSMFMDFYAASARRRMAEYGTTPAEFAAVSAKNSLHGSLNPNAQFQVAMSVDEVLDSPMIADPLTRPMCSPIGDGAAATIIGSAAALERLGKRGDGVRILASELTSGVTDSTQGAAVDLAVQRAYESAALGPADLDVVEVHDASASAELDAYETLGLCEPGDAARMVVDGTTALGGSLPVNTSGGLLRKGHPIGATGLGQIVELSDQLRGRAGNRQVEGARIGLAHNNGGNLGGDVAAACITILEGIPT